MKDRVDFHFYLNIFWLVWNTGFSVFDYVAISRGNSNWLVWTGLILCGSVAVMNFFVLIYKTYLIIKRVSNESHQIRKGGLWKN